MIVSHYDADHLNGLVGALNTMTTDVVYAPDYACDTRVCNSFHNEIVEQNIELIHPKPKKIPLNLKRRQSLFYLRKIIPILKIMIIL